MHRSIFADRPWVADPDPKATLPSLVAYSFPEERQIAVWLAREVYQGRGAIIDAGAFFGGSALSLATGLDQNKRVGDAEKAGAIHVFDTFRYSPWMHKEHYPAGKTNGDSFLDIFHQNVVRYSEMMTIHLGFIDKRPWRFGPIEILFIDCAKSLSANAAMVKNFFPHLIPGVSIVNQQDFGIPNRLMWIYATMEYFWDRFEDLGTTSSGGTTLFRLIEPISAVDARACNAAIEADCLEMARRHADRFPETDRRRAAILAGLAAFERDYPTHAWVTARRGV